LEFWITEIDRILEAHPGDAELHAAAALILNQPCSLYVSQLSRKVTEEGSLSLWDFQSAIIDQMRESRSRFDRVGSARAIELIRRATELEPNNLNWWRLRAILSWPPLTSFQDDRPRDENWKQVFEESRDHDPGNALYDVIEGRKNSELAIDFDDNSNDVVGDPKAWIDTLELAERIGKASHLTLGEPAIRGLERLHKLSRHPTAFTIESIRTRFADSRASHNCSLLIRNLSRMSEVKGATPGPHNRAEIIELAKKVSDFATVRSDKPLPYDHWLAMLRVFVWETKQKLEQQEGQVSEPTQAGLDEAKRWRSAIQAAASHSHKRKTAAASPINEFLSAVSLSLLTAFLGLSLLSIFTWLVTSRSLVSLRLACWPFAAMLTGICLSYFFLGMGPAGAVPDPVQHWMLTGIAFGFITILLAGIAIRTRFRVRFGIRSLLIASALAAVTLQAAFHWRLGWSAFGLPIQVHAQADPLLSIFQTQSMQIQGTSSHDPWLPGPSWVSNSMAEWLMHDGPSWSVGISLGLALIAFVWKRPFADAIGQLLIASTVAALILANVWVWVEPRNYISSRPSQIPLETYIRSLDDYYAPVEADVKRELARYRESVS
jgi:hypothetical protein